MGEAKPNSEIFRLIGKRMGLTHPCLDDDDLTIIRQAIDSPHERKQGVTFEKLMEHGWQRLGVPRPFLPYAEGNFPSAEWQV